MKAIFDLIVIGTGTVGSSVAQRCSAAGWRVAIVDNRPFGGTCALRGCEPKKTLWTVVEVYDRARRHKAKRYAEAGIEAFAGTARFVRPDAVAIGDEVLVAKHILIATGAKPGSLPIGGAELLKTSDEFLELDQLPDRILFVGGGYILRIRSYRGAGRRGRCNTT